MINTEYFMLAALPLLVLGIFLYFRHRAKMRTEAMQHLAKSRGWRFEARMDSEQWRVWGDFPLLERGRAGRASNLVSGQADGFEFTLMDFRYTTGSGQRSSTHHQSVVYLHGPNLKLPKFELCPEHFGHRLIAVFGYQDIDFDASPQFSSRYLLRGEHESRIRKLFAPNLRRYLESIPERSIEGHNDGLLVFSHRHRCRPEEAETVIRAAVRIAGRFAN